MVSSYTEISPSTPTLRQKLVAEMFGTAILVQVGCGGLCAGTYLGAMDGSWQMAAMWILGGTLGIYASASTSGGHLNPAVSLAFAFIRPDDFSISELGPYIVAQLVGGILAGLTNLAIFSKAMSNYNDANPDGGNKVISTFGDYYSTDNNVSGMVHAVFIEMLGTAFLTFIIFSVTHPKNTSVPAGAVPFIVGSAIGTMVSLFGALTGCAINPARDLGPRLVTLFAGYGSPMDDYLVYIIGPFLGGPIGAFLADKVLMA